MGVEVLLRVAGEDAWFASVATASANGGGHYGAVWEVSGAVHGGGPSALRNFLSCQPLLMEARVGIECLRSRFRSHSSDFPPDFNYCWAALTYAA